MKVNETTSYIPITPLENSGVQVESEISSEPQDIVSLSNSAIASERNEYTSLLTHSLLSEHNVSNRAVAEFRDSSILYMLQTAYLAEIQATSANNNISNKTKLVIALCSLGNGLANMPIFNHEVQKLGGYHLDVHANDTLFATSTINTMAIQTICTFVAGCKLYTDLKNSPVKENLRSNLALGIGIAGTLITSSLPLAQLWKIELNDQKISDNNGFDQFIAWATFTSLPLIVAKAVKSFQVLHRYLNSNSLSASKLESIGAKIFVNGTCALAAVGRFVAHASAINEVCKHAEIDEKLGLSISIILGAVSSTLMGACEYLSVRNLFKKQDSPATKTEIALSTLSTLEGAWFTLPTISSGLSATKEWNPLLQALTFAPLFVSHTIAEATSFYNSRPFQKETSTSINFNV